MIAAAPAIDNLTLDITQDIHVRASIAATFAALLEQMGPANEGHNGSPMPMTIEAWPVDAGSAIWEATTDISGATCKPSSDRPCSKSPGR
jgi:hypothetical protein